MRVALSLSRDAAARLSRDAGRFGHELVADADAVAAMKEWLGEVTGEPGAGEPDSTGSVVDLVVAEASPLHLDAELVAACDTAGVPMAVIAGSAVERRHASALGFLDTYPEASWEAITPAGVFEPLGPVSGVDRVATAMRRSEVERLAERPGERPAERLAERRAERPAELSGGIRSDGPTEAAAPARSPRSQTTASHHDDPTRAGKMGRSSRSRTTASAPESPRAPSGSVVTVWGASGAPGRTSIALAIAAELGAAGVYTALGDADTHAASVAPALGLLDEAPGFAAACRLAGAGGLTPEEFERVGHYHRGTRGGFWVLTGLGRPSRWPELPADRVSGAIAASRGWVDTLVLDTASSLEQDEELLSDVAVPRRNSATLEALRAADHVVAVAAADPIGIARFLRAHAELLELVDPERVTVVVNKVRPGSIGAGAAAQVRQTLARFGGIEHVHVLPWDPAAFDAALLSGRPLTDAAPRSGARAGIRRLVTERLLPPDAVRAVG